MIKVVHCKRELNNEYVGRPNPLGNPFVLKNEIDRPMIVIQYKKWIYNMIKNKDVKVLAELDRLFMLALEKDINLGCWCAPKLCHANIIKEILDERIKKYKSQFERR